MIVVPSRRWFWGAAALAVIAPLGLIWPTAGIVLLALDLGWILAFVLDARATLPVAALDVRREAPSAFSLGRTVEIGYRWRHPRARAVTVMVREQFPAPLGGADTPTRLLRVPPNDGLDERMEVVPARRGLGEGGALAVRVLGPLGLAWRQGARTLPWNVTVYPSVTGAALRALPLQSLQRREAGLRNVRRPGEGRFFEGLREWVPGDDTRIIDWKATARRGKPIARQYEDERRQQVLIVVDAGRLLTADVGGVPRLETVLAAALHLAYAAIERDDNVGVMIFADTVQRFVPPARGPRALRAVLDALAAAEGRLVESDYPAAFRYLATRNRKRALTVLFTDVIDRTASDALLTHTATLRPRHLPLAVTLRDPALEAVAVRRPARAADAFERAAAEALLGARDDALAEMRGHGVVVLDVPPEAASRAVVEQYHRLKRRGLL